MQRCSSVHFLREITAEKGRHLKVAIVIVASNLVSHVSNILGDFCSSLRRFRGKCVLLLSP